MVSPRKPILPATTSGPGH